MVFVELRAQKKLLLEVQAIKESVLRETVKEQEDENPLDAEEQNDTAK
jgi:hypothetical protein